MVPLQSSVSALNTCLLVTSHYKKASVWCYQFSPLPCLDLKCPKQKTVYTVNSNLTVYELRREEDELNAEKTGETLAEKADAS